MNSWSLLLKLVYRLSVEVSATYRLPKANPPLADKSSLGFVFRRDLIRRIQIRINDNELQQTIPNRLVVSVANLNPNLSLRNHWEKEFNNGYLVNLNGSMFCER